jgi:hypothetical protein
MRTTVTLDEDVAAALKRVAAERGVGFKEALNTAVRAGLRSEATRARRYRMPRRRLGLRPGVDLTKALRLAAALEDEELIAKLELRK